MTQQRIQTPDWLSTADTTAICEGRLDDPFAVLGPHHRGVAGRLVVFDPHAEGMTARAGDRRWPLAPVPGCPGLFAGEIAPGAAYVL